MLPPTDFGGTLRSSDACGKLQSVYGGNLPQSPQRGEPQRQIPTEGNPPAGLAPQRTGSPPAALALQRTGSPTIATFSPGKCHLQLS
ncbi:hypothetical protein DP115_06265 [Brasilonema octagenarum UFV-OR1]|uniref:Uncharacterized protein n=1 Tax=Brasilonema octagenarum UFV-OR1 TaxID=417115 RepID=A0ABX1M4L9_9CYAN|nr:hypothetical protein [Brasilonema octagenarum UFV-OR1]